MDFHDIFVKICYRAVIELLGSSYHIVKICIERVYVEYPLSQYHEGMNHRMSNLRTRTKTPVGVSLPNIPCHKRQPYPVSNNHKAQNYLITQARSGTSKEITIEI